MAYTTLIKMDLPRSGGTNEFIVSDWFDTDPDSYSQSFDYGLYSIFIQYLVSGKFRIRINAQDGWLGSGNKITQSITVSGNNGSTTFNITVCERFELYSGQHTEVHRIINDSEMMFGLTIDGNVIVTEEHLTEHSCSACSTAVPSYKNLASSKTYSVEVDDCHLWHITRTSTTESTYCVELYNEATDTKLTIYCWLYGYDGTMSFNGTYTYLGDFPNTTSLRTYKAKANDFALGSEIGVSVIEYSDEFYPNRGLSGTILASDDNSNDIIIGIKAQNAYNKLLHPIVLKGEAAIIQTENTYSIIPIYATQQSYYSSLKLIRNSVFCFPNGGGSKDFVIREKSSTPSTYNDVSVDGYTIVYNGNETIATNVIEHRFTITSDGTVQRSEIDLGKGIIEVFTNTSNQIAITPYPYVATEDEQVISLTVSPNSNVDYDWVEPLWEMNGGTIDNTSNTATYKLKRNLDFGVTPLVSELELDMDYPIVNSNAKIELSGSTTLPYLGKNLSYSLIFTELTPDIISVVGSGLEYKYRNTTENVANDTTTVSFYLSLTDRYYHADEPYCIIVTTKEGVTKTIPLERTAPVVELSTYTSTRYYDWNVEDINDSTSKNYKNVDTIDSVILENPWEGLSIGEYTVSKSELSNYTSLTLKIPISHHYVASPDATCKIIINCTGYDGLQYSDTIICSLDGYSKLVELGTYVLPLDCEFRHYDIATWLVNDSTLLSTSNHIIGSNSNGKTGVGYAFNVSGSTCNKINIIVTDKTPSIKFEKKTNEITVNTPFETSILLENIWTGGFYVNSSNGWAFDIVKGEIEHVSDTAKRLPITITATDVADTDITCGPSGTLYTLEGDSYDRPEDTFTLTSIEEPIVYPDGEIVTPNNVKPIIYYGGNFQYTIETNNIESIYSYYINFNGDRYLDTIDGFISIEMVNMNNFNITVEENEGDERNCNIIFQYIDYNGKQLTHSLRIVQDAKPEEEPEEPDVPPTPPTPDEPAEPSYVILSNNNITLDGEGDTKDVSVTYTNMGEIIMPEVPEGYEIEEVERTDSDNITQVKYRIKKVSKNKGNFILNFTGKDTEGNTVTSEDLNVEGKGQSTTPAEVTYYSYNTENDVMIFDYTGSTAEIKFNIEGYTKPFDFHVSVNDDNYNVHLMTNELDYDDGVDYAVWKMVFESEGNDSSSAYEGNVVVTYTDANTEKIFTIPFHVRYANEGKLTLGSKEFRYDKDGELLTNYNTISVGYLNIQTKHQPTCSTWVTLGTPTQRGGTFYGIDEMWDYPISVQANEGAERTGFVRFTGLGEDGKEYAIEAVVKQEGDNTVIKVDEGYIELQSLSVALPASGGSETFQVKYYDAAEIFEPELGDTWATVTEVSRTEPADDVAWNGEECQSVIVTYRATAQPTDSGRQMKVKFFSDINYYDGGLVHMEKDKFIIYQLAEGSTEVQGSLHVLRSSLEYTYYGSPIGWNPEVGYTDLAPSTPIISENWCRIKSYTDKTSKEYDVIRSYDLELDTNESTFSRTCNITFIGEAEDGTDVRKTITITQKGQEEIINDGEYSNYKGYFRSYDDILYSVSFITNPRSETYGDIRLAGDSPVVVSYSESDRLFTPLRTSTCTVKVVSEYYLMNLYTGKAHGTQVILRNEDTDSVEWCGFLQPNLYNQGFTECMEEIEFEASDCLSTLQYFEYKEHYSNGRFTVTFKDIIDDIMVKCGILDSYYLTQKPFSDGFQSRNANFQYFYIPEENFFSEEGEPWKYQEVLEEICKYLGVVCFQWKDDLYFIDYDRYQTNKTMLGYRWDKSDDWRTMNSVTLSNPNQIVEESYKETGADISLDDVFNKVTVNCNYYNFEDIIPDLFDDDKLVNRFENNGYISIGRWTANHNSELETMDYYRIYDHQNINSRYYEPLSGTGLHEREITPTDSILEDKYFFRKYVGGNIVDMVHLNYSEANGKVGETKDWERYLMISQLNRPWCGHEGTFHWENYNFPIMEFKNIPVIFIDNTADEDTDTPIRVSRPSSSSTPHNRTPKPRPVPNYLVIKAEAIFSGILNKEYFEGLAEGLGKKSSQSWYTYGGSSIDEVRNTPALCFYLEIPQAGWWNGSEWVHYKTHFEVRLDRFTDGSDNNKKYYEHMFGIEKDVYNTVETNLFLGTTGYRIPLPKEMTTTQQMYFAIAMPKRFVHCSDSYGGDYTGDVGNAYCFIKELEMKICNRNSIFFKNEDVIYENIIDEGNVIEGEEIDMKITSDNYEGFSFSHVSTVTAEEKNTTDISFYNKEMKLVKAEEGIIERYVNQYSTPSIKENVTLDMSFTPTQLITDTYWDKDFVIIGQEIDYKYDRQRLTLLEKK